MASSLWCAIVLWYDPVLIPSISRMLSADAADGPLKTAGTVFFSFQFYRNQQVTSERYNDLIYYHVYTVPT